METKYLIIAGGILLLSVTIFQVLSGLRAIKVPAKWHKVGGLTLLLVAIVHATIALIYLLN